MAAGDDGVDIGTGGISCAYNFCGPFAVGVTPVILPHKNKSRFVILAGKSIRQDVLSAAPYEVLDTYLQHYQVHQPVFIHRHHHIQDISYHRHITDVDDHTIVHGPHGCLIHTDRARYERDCEYLGPTYRGSMNIYLLDF